MHLHQKQSGPKHELLFMANARIVESMLHVPFDPVGGFDDDLLL